MKGKEKKKERGVKDSDVSEVCVVWCGGVWLSLLVWVWWLNITVFSPSVGVAFKSGHGARHPALPLLELRVIVRHQHVLTALRHHHVARRRVAARPRLTDLKEDAGGREREGERERESVCAWRDYVCVCV